MKTKKAIFTTIAFMLVTASSMAAGRADSVRYLNSRFKDNWFISADGNIDWWQGSDKNPNGNYTAVQWGKPSFGASFNVGKWFTHSFGMRLSYDVNGGKSYIDGLHANRPFMNFLFDGDFHYDDNGNFISYDNGSAPDENGYYNTKFMYHNLHLDAFLSPIDLFSGYYNPNRIYTPVLYVGLGCATVSQNIFVTPDLVNNSRNKDDSFAQKGVNMEMSFAAGLINNFKISKHFDLHLDIKWAFSRWNIDSWFNEMGGLLSDEGMYGTEGIRPKRIDNNYSVGLGITYNFNRLYELPVNCTSELEETRRRLKNIEDELAAAAAAAAIVDSEPCDTVVKFVNVQTEDIISYPFSIFFNRDSYQLMSRRDLINLREIANVAKEKGYKLRLRGTCDSATASAAYNQTLSENRCRKVMMELMEMGIPESQIILVPMGGVKELDPTEYDRRVLIELVKEAPKN